MKYTFDSPLGRLVIQDMPDDGWELRIFKRDGTWKRAWTEFDDPASAAERVANQETGWPEWDHLPEVPSGIHRLSAWNPIAGFRR